MARGPCALAAVCAAALLLPVSGGPAPEDEATLERDVLLAARPGGEPEALLRAGTRVRILGRDREEGLRVALEGWLPADALLPGAAGTGSHAPALFALHLASRAAAGPLAAPGMRTVRVDTARPTLRAGAIRLVLTAVGRNRGRLPLAGLVAEVVLLAPGGQEMLRARGRAAAEILAPGQETVAEVRLRLTPAQARAFDRRRVRVRWLVESPD